MWWVAFDQGTKDQGRLRLQRLKLKLKVEALRDCDIIARELTDDRRPEQPIDPTCT
jgi:hypothetical protein